MINLEKKIWSPVPEAYRLDLCLPRLYPTGTEPRGHTDDVTADRHGMNCEGHKQNSSNQIRLETSTVAGQTSTAQQDTDPKHTARATKEPFIVKKFNILPF